MNEQVAKQFRTGEVPTSKIPIFPSDWFVVVVVVVVLSSFPRRFVVVVAAAAAAAVFVTSHLLFTVS